MSAAGGGEQGVMRCDQYEEQEVSIQFNNYQRQLMLHHVTHDAQVDVADDAGEPQMWYNNLIMKTLAAATASATAHPPMATQEDDDDDEGEAISNNTAAGGGNGYVLRMRPGYDGQVSAAAAASAMPFVLRERNGGDGEEELNRWKSQRSSNNINNNTMGHYF